MLLGYLRMNVDEAIEGLVSVASAVFPNNSYQDIDPELNMKNLRAAIEEILQARSIPLETPMHDKQQPPQTCKVYVS